MMVMGALWGLQFSLAKIGMRDGIAPAAWIFAINLVGAPVLLGIAAWRGTPPSALRGHVRYALIAGATAVAVPHAVLVTVMSHVPAGLAAVLYLKIKKLNADDNPYGAFEDSVPNSAQDN